MSHVTHAARAPQRPLTPGARAFRHVARLEGPAIFRYTRALERRAPERFEAFVSHLQRSLNSNPARTGSFTKRELRAALLGNV